MMLDQVDKKLLSLLNQNARQQYSDLGKALHLSAPAVHARVKRLEKEGVIENFTIRIRPEAANKSVCAFVRVNAGSESCIDTAKFLEKFPEIEECHSVAGEDCVLLKVRVGTPGELDELLQKVRKAPGFQRTLTTVVLKSHFERGTTIS
ncbi:MAG: Lrp/AsnC family transcriptional regulator [Bdellovibrionota bacterium]